MEAGKETCIGFDVGKAAHRACAVSCKTGEILFNGAIENREGPIDGCWGLRGAGRSWSSTRSAASEPSCSSAPARRAWTSPTFPAFR